jgi:hypothetical protein
MQGPRLTRRAAALAITAAALFALASVAGAQAATISVDPGSGNDANPGTATAPLKTLGQALSKATAGDTIKLAGGGYGTTPQGFGNGEQFPASGLPVPSGVTLEGATSSGFPTATLLGQGTGIALNLKGNASVRNLIFGFRGFGVSIVAREGAQTLSNLFIPISAANVGNVDGFPLSAGILLRGTANARLDSGAQQANTTGTNLIIDSGTGVHVNEQARFTMSGGLITGGDQPNCRTGATGVELNQSAQATLENLVPPGGIRNLAGTALRLTDNSKATVSQSAILRTLPAGCTAGATASTSGSSALTFDRVVDHTTGGDGATAIETSAQSGLTLKNNSSILTTAGDALHLRGAGAVSIDQSSVDARSGIAVDAASTGAPLTITRSFIDGGSRVTDSGIRASKLKLRDSKLNNGKTGVVVTGAGVDLGNAGEPGNNDFSNLGVTGVRVNTVGVLVRAIGNVWNPNVQGADTAGRYPKPFTVTGNSPVARGRNFELPTNTSNVGIDLGPPGPVGTFRLSPKTLSVRAGRATAWRLAWTHPVSWKRLDDVVLRLESRGRAGRDDLARPADPSAARHGRGGAARGRAQRHLAPHDRRPAPGRQADGAVRAALRRPHPRGEAHRERRRRHAAALPQSRTRAGTCALTQAGGAAAWSPPPTSIRKLNKTRTSPCTHLD